MLRPDVHVVLYNSLGACAIASAVSNENNLAIYWNYEDAEARANELRAKNPGSTIVVATVQPR